MSPARRPAGPTRPSPTARTRRPPGAPPPHPPASSRAPTTPPTADRPPTPRRPHDDAPDEPAITDPRPVLDALGDDTRRRIVALLATGEHSVGSLVDALGTVSQPAVSQHLRVLRDAGLVAARADGTRRLHRLDPDGVAAAQGWLAALLDPLAGIALPLDALATEVARGRRARRTGPGPGTGTGTGTSTSTSTGTDPVTSTAQHRTPA